MGGSALWQTARGLMGQKGGDDETRWRARVTREEMADRVRWVVSGRWTWRRSLGIVMGAASFTW